MFNKAVEVQESLGDSHASEGLAQVALDIGNGFFGQKTYAVAIKWLRRAFDILGKIDPVCLSDRGSEIRFAVMHGLALACIQNAEEDDFDCARSTIGMMFEVCSELVKVSMC